MRYMTIFAGVVILIGIVFMILTVRASRKAAHRAASTSETTPATPPQPPTQSVSREGDDAYRHALRQHASSSTSLPSYARQHSRRALSDDAYRDALRRVKQERDDATSRPEQKEP